MKTCRRCGEDKGADQFRVLRRVRWADAPDSVYRSSWCRDCDREYALEWRSRHPGYHAKWSRNYRRMKA